MDMDMAEMKHASSFVSDNEDDPEAEVWWRSSVMPVRASLPNSGVMKEVGLWIMVSAKPMSSTMIVRMCGGAGFFPAAT